MSEPIAIESTLSEDRVFPPPAEFASVPLIEKPYTVDRVTPAIEAALAG